MRLLMVNYEFPPIGGGGAQAHYSLLTHFSKCSDLHVDVLTSAVGMGCNQEMFSDNICIHRVGIHKKSLHYWRKQEVIEWLFRAGFLYRRLVRENKYDLVHAFFGFPSAWLCYGSRKKLPYLISLRGSDVPGMNARLALDYKILGPLFKRIWTGASGIIACSNGLKKRALDFLPSVKIDVIPNGVDTARFYGVRVNDPEQVKVQRLITVGRLSSTKRVHCLIEALGYLRDNYRVLKLTVVGGGALFDSLQQLVHDLDLTDYVDLKGRVNADQMPELYRSHDIFVSATMQEGMSNAMLEAMASALPIITTRCEGLKELITDNGIIIDNSDAETIANAVETLCNDPELYCNMSISARERAEKFQWSNMAMQYIDRYQEVCVK